MAPARVTSPVVGTVLWKQDCGVYCMRISDCSSLVPVLFLKIKHGIFYNLWHMFKMYYGSLCCHTYNVIEIKINEVWKHSIDVDYRKKIFIWTFLTKHIYKAYLHESSISNIMNRNTFICPDDSAFPPKLMRERWCFLQHNLVGSIFIIVHRRWFLVASWNMK